MKFDFDCQVVSEEKKFKGCGRWRWIDNGAYLYYKLAYEPKGSGELKIPIKNISAHKIFIC